MNETSWSRRQLLASAGVAGLGLPLCAAEPPVAEAPPKDGKEALARLKAGNARFAAGKTRHAHESAEWRKHLVGEQKPIATVIGCSDSRVPPELVFDQGFGDLFVCRAAGNIVTPELIGSLEFGTAVLGARALMVLGHTHCGAVKATIAGQAVPGQISTLYRHIRPAVDRSTTRELEDVARHNVRIQAELLRTASPVIAQLVKEEKLVVVGGMYDLETGGVTLLDG